ncbi:hypothetical protein E4U13_004511 [Claviceps humidiphila]|uniref:Uncharacterized protein n=1 Tax=Claviceps humidiphila TaxID=1294629 RepID=A0A9P7PW55_9HYPO|nr:hypothetical protein E4U13_004511 [Claviceps humidiphila]
MAKFHKQAQPEAHGSGPRVTRSHGNQSREGSQSRGPSGRVAIFTTSDYQPPPPPPPPPRAYTSDLSKTVAGM